MEQRTATTLRRFLPVTSSCYPSAVLEQIAVVASSAALTVAAVAAAHGIGQVRRGFVATVDTFQGYERWTRFDRGSQPVGPQHPDGSSAVFVSAVPPHGAEAFADGTVILRVTTAADPDPRTWELHAMVKRGGAFNSDGARGWEFFDLHLEPDAAGVYRPAIAWRGDGPPQGDGYVAPEGGVELGCNHCHGAAVDNDSVLGPELALDSF